MKSITKKNIRTSFYPLWQQYNKFKAYLLRYPKSGNGFETVSQSKMIQYNKVRYHGAKRLFCYNPFVNIFFNINGDAIACCRSHQTVLGKYPEQSIKEIWFGKRFEKMREHMLHNDLNMGCEYCKLQIESNRFHSLPSMHPEEFATDKVGIFPRILELELSNTCNLQCVMCSGRVSSSIRKHREKLPPIVSPYDEAFVDQLKEFIPHLKKICFYGGEPFLIDIYYKILDIVIKINPSIRIYAVTNGTIFNQKIANLLKSVPFNLLVSIDSLKPDLFSQIRVGAKLNEVIENFKKFQNLTNGNTSISHTPMRLNWTETPDIIKFCNQHNSRVNLSYVDKPANIALWSLSIEKLDEIYNFYQKIKFESTANQYTEKYNIKVFNEWKEQIRFFRNRNSEIMKSFGNLEYKFEELNTNLTQTIHSFFQHVPNNWMTFDQALNIIDIEVLEKPNTPAKLEAVKIIIEDFTKIDMIQTDHGRSFLTDIDKFKEYASSLISEDQFWARYY
ncbi:MAG: twitch domain-containing radical SAM protein [Bacteroidales bacterium]|jgi:MoaA/NifB/PqqE/SkfB family radical SAM enzyme|nr:twitch domain-containing radical SAM protein [Bacteroidales bacterium]